jgi:hypothetical protein
MNEHADTRVDDAMNAEHDAMIERYLNELMDEEERTAFEIALVSDPVLLERTRVLEAFKQGLNRHSDDLLAAPVVEFPVPFAAWLRQPQSLAASVLVAVLGFGWAYSQLSGPAAGGISLPVGSLVLLEGERGSGAIELSGARPYLFQIDVGLGTSTGPFTVAVREAASNRLVTEQQGLSADGNGWVRLLIDNELAGEYQVELSWRDAQGGLMTRSFLVARSQ